MGRGFEQVEGGPSEEVRSKETVVLQVRQPGASCQLRKHFVQYLTCITKQAKAYFRTLCFV